MRLLPSPSPVADRARWLDIARGRLHEQFGRFLNRLGVPGAVAPMRYHDESTGCTIEVSVSAFYTRLGIDGRDFYFHRVTGKFDGTGQAL